MNCTSYTFTIVIDKNLPSEIYLAVHTMFSALVAAVMPHLLNYATGIQHWGACGKTFFTQHVFPMLLSGYWQAYNLTENTMYDLMYRYRFYRYRGVFVIGAVVVVLVVLRYVKRIRATRIEQIESFMNKIEQVNNKEEIQNFVSAVLKNHKVLQQQEPDCDSYCDCDSDCSGNYPPSLPSLVDVALWGQPISRDERDERDDPTYNPDSDSDESNSDDEEVEQQIANALSHGREGVLPERRSARKFIRKNQTQIRKPLPAYIFFCKDARPRIIEQTPGISFGNIARKMGQQWRNLPEDEKAVYYKLAAEARSQYFQQQKQFQQFQQFQQVAESESD